MIIEPAQKLSGTLRMPGDKSIAHRALILGALASGPQIVRRLPTSGDVRSTVACLESLGVTIEAGRDGDVTVHGGSFVGRVLLNAGNSGTTARLICGVLAGRPVEATLDGDTSLRRRPMERLAEPLRQMGAEVITTNGGLPMVVHGGPLRAIHHRLAVASAQLKSAVLIAGLAADGTTVVVEPATSRDHTERMLSAMGARIERDGLRVRVRGGVLEPIEVVLPGDVSSAANHIIAAACLPGSELRIEGTGVNPTRTGLVEVLARMGARIETDRERMQSGEPVADIVVRASGLNGVTVAGDMIPRLVDEIPVLAVAATRAEGVTIVSGAEELRHKESDRIRATVENLSRLGADIAATEDGFIVRGPTRLTGGAVSSFGDHRIAMAMAVAGLLAEGPVRIEDSGATGVSYPSFFDDLRRVTRA